MVKRSKAHSRVTSMHGGCFSSASVAVWRVTYCVQIVELFGSELVSWQLYTHPSPNPTSYNKLISMCQCWVRGGVGAHLPRY